jgi:hypothetical protein
MRETIRQIFVRTRRLARSRWSAILGLPMVGRHRGLNLRRMSPLSDGRPRGQPIVRYYWERFLEAHRSDIRGRCLEIGGTLAIRRYGGTAVTHADSIDVTRHSEEITVVADLSRADHMLADTYDCFVNPFTLHLIYDIEAALYHSLRVLKPEGVLLANFPCVDYYFDRGLDMGTGRPLFMFWWFTPIQVENLFRRVGLQSGDYQLRIDGNLFARVAYQLNMASEELSRAELDHADPGHPLLISVRAVKPVHWHVERPAYREAWIPSVAPQRWNPVTGHYPAAEG